jgi:hypothetical protein
LDGWSSPLELKRRITQDEYDKKARELKERQTEIAVRRAASKGRGRLPNDAGRPDFLGFARSRTVRAFDGGGRSSPAMTPRTCCSQALVIRSPNRHEEANEIIENPKRAKELYEQRFVAVLDKTINDLLRESSRESSPILESMKTAAIASFGPSERQQIPFRMTIIPDMIQNTAPIRQFNTKRISSSSRAAQHGPHCGPVSSVCIKHRLILDRRCGNRIKPSWRTPLAEVTNLAISTHLSFIHTRGGCGIVLVVTPRRMTEMYDEIAVV